MKRSGARLDIDTEAIETLADLLQRTGLTEIEIAQGESRVRVVRAPAPLVAALGAEAPPGRNSPVAASPVPPTADAQHPGAVRAPMVGTAYLSPEPGATPFITTGSEVREGQTLLIIEAMKVMNPIRSQVGGRVRQILIGNGDPVEYGELLVVIE